MAFTKITSEDTTGKGVVGLPDTPGLSALDLQKKFDELATDVLIPKFNNLVSELESTSAAGNIGMESPAGVEADGTVQAVVEKMAEMHGKTEEKAHIHENKSVLDSITGTVKAAYDRLVTLFKTITEVSNTVSDSSESIPTGKAIVAYVNGLAGGDMKASTYDKDNSGVVDDAEKLGGKEPSHYQPVTDTALETENKTVPGAINELKKAVENEGGGSGGSGGGTLEFVEVAIGEGVPEDSQGSYDFNFTEILADEPIFIYIELSETSFGYKHCFYIPLPTGMEVGVSYGYIAGYVYNEEFNKFGNVTMYFDWADENTQLAKINVPDSTVWTLGAIGYYKNGKTSDLTNIATVEQEGSILRIS